MWHMQHTINNGNDKILFSRVNLFLFFIMGIPVCFYPLWTWSLSSAHDTSKKYPQNSVRNYCKLRNRMTVFMQCFFLKTKYFYFVHRLCKSIFCTTRWLQYLQDGCRPAYGSELLWSSLCPAWRPIWLESLVCPILLFVFCRIKSILASLKRSCVLSERVGVVTLESVAKCGAAFQSWTRWAIKEKRMNAK